MLRRLDKIRFRSQRRDDFLDLDVPLNTSDTDCTQEVQMNPEASDPDEPMEADSQVDSEAFADILQDDPNSDLNEVKGHLEIALWEKLYLQEELRKLQEEMNVDLLKQELEKERSRRLELELKMNQLLTSRLEDTPPWPAEDMPPPPPAVCSKDKHTDGLYVSLHTWFYDCWGVYIQDFHFPPEDVSVEPEEPLSAKRLTENTRRLKRGLRPLRTFMRNLSALSSWSSVYTSAITFLIYMYAAWHGRLVPVFLFLAILRLSLNYLICRGWRIQWTIVPEVFETEEEVPKVDRTVSEKFQLVLDVAQKAQNLFGNAANILEKIKNLLMWVRPELTKKLYVALWVSFIASCLLPYGLLAIIIGLYAGIKFFIIGFVFKCCPKLRQRYDTPYVIWNSLPTDLQLKETTNTTLNGQVPVAAGRGNVWTAAAPDVTHRDSRRASKRGPFHQVFKLSESERPLAGSEGGWRCYLIDRGRKSPKEYIRYGVLYVTENYLCFESSSSRSNSSRRTKVIKLVDITNIQKYKALSMLPGSGMGISIQTPSTPKPLVFGAMVHRDEAFDIIFTQYTKTVATVTAAET
ncbi:GRAM domain-containing protein 4-like [Thalassophryne amazonica]|uniref:GRAM domain-containing protein 4-like n=1 Tax=Thalassophryne amazonica TaxID=390379 RepID=UPI001471CF1D|nr:GRAM domain-containing protein 4-like [Thalassophryne amazonica]XP_034033252.1 GRAM domain-containing protein 4-like [Thalassophryne amazonica]XP_034033253.1 GRAM domain-containing protein 4-like [Thalassophryne amazonica]